MGDLLFLILQSLLKMDRHRRCCMVRPSPYSTRKEGKKSLVAPTKDGALGRKFSAASGFDKQQSLSCSLMLPARSGR